MPRRGSYFMPRFSHYGQAAGGRRRRSAWSAFLAQKARENPGVPANVLAANFSHEWRMMTGRGGCY